MIKKLLYIFLVISFLIDIIIGAIILGGGESGLRVFKMEPTPDSMYLAFLIGCFCVLVSLLCILAIVMLKRDNPSTAQLIYILSFWWIAIGLGCWFGFGKPNNLLTDTLKGVVLIVLTYLYSKQKNLKEN